MSRSVRTLLGALLTVCVSAALPLVSGADAQIYWKPCGNSNVQACGHLTVALDPTGTMPGVITLAMRRQRAPVGEAKDAVIALAGGPGQAAIPFTSVFSALLGPILSNRDLIVFDQRGTGLSHPLSCPAFEHLGAGPSPGAVSICAAQLGATRDVYTTDQTVADIEAIRRAGGYEKLVLYGTSYGTKVAERYAQTYPSHVEALILDSVVTPNGPDPLNLSTFEAIPRVLRAICAFRACAHITSHPFADLSRLVHTLRRRPLRGHIRVGGAFQTVAVHASDLLGILLEGDLDPRLRIELPAAIHTALENDSKPLLDLLVRAQSDAESEPESLAEGFDVPLYFTTTCEETLFPFNRAASPATRLREALLSISSRPVRSFAPFHAAEVLALGDIPVCARWPYTNRPPSADTTHIPSVPTLILSGAEDLRTPTSNAQQLASEIPGAHLLVVPYTGHSVLGSDPSGCSERALQALFAGKSIQSCPVGPPPAFLAPTPLPHIRHGHTAGQ